MALTDLATVKEWMGILPSSIDDDTLLERLIDAVSGTIERYLGRALTSAARTEYYTCRGGTVLPLYHYPITAVATLTVDGEAIPVYSSLTGCGYLIDTSMLLLNGYTFSTPESTDYNNVTVVYTAGYSTIPYDIEQAAIHLVSLRYRERDRIGQQSKILAGETVRYSVFDMPPDVQAVLNQYRDVRL
jgi:hypothetical protein